MKKLFRLLACCLCAAFALVSCETKEGGWDPISLDKYEVSFGTDGGEEVITSSNYPGMYIMKLENLTTQEKGNRSKDRQSANMEGIELKVEGNRLIVTVDASKEPRSWMINLSYLDAGCSPIYVHQK